MSGFSELSEADLPRLKEQRQQLHWKLLAIDDQIRQIEDKQSNERQQQLRQFLAERDAGKEKLKRIFPL